MTVVATTRRTPVWPVLTGVALLAKLHRRRYRGAVAGGRADRHRTARSGSGHHAGSAVRAGRGGDRRRAGGGVLPVRGVSRAAAGHRGPDASGYRALGWAPSLSGGVGGCAALLVPLTLSDVSGQPLREHLSPTRVWSLASLIDIAGAWRWTAFLAAAVTVISLPVLRWSWTPVLLAGSLATLVPLGLTGTRRSAALTTSPPTAC